MKNEQISLDAKDLFVVLGMAFVERPPKAWTYDQLAKQVGLSVSQVHGAAQRLVLSGLLTPQGIRGAVNKKGLLDFLLHGARFVFPAVFGKPARGIKTGVSSEFFKHANLVKDGQIWVWPTSEGNDRGISLAPLHPSALKAIHHNAELHKALVYFDALRGGQARERQAAEAFFKQALAWRS